MLDGSPSPRIRLLSHFLALLAFGPLLSGCSAVKWAGMQVFYEPATLEQGRIFRDVPYRTDENADPEEHRLDLFLPPEDPDRAPFSTLIFVHGGGWNSGDKNLKFGGQDIYGNIGRFYASRGYGVAVINYRLLPDVTWREQIADVAAAMAWVAQHIDEYGGAPDQLFLTGHSAGAQLVTFVALEGRTLRQAGTSTAALCGVLPISGGAFDMVDPETYRLGAEIEYLEERFRVDEPDGVWQREASALLYLPDQPPGAVPPFFLTYSRREWPWLQHQNRLLHAALQEAGVDSQLLPVKGQSHARMVLQFTDPESPISQHALEFFSRVPCPRQSTAILR